MALNNDQIQRSSEYFRKAIKKAEDMIDDMNGAHILRLDKNSTLEHVEQENPDVIIIDGNGSEDTGPIKNLLVRLEHINVPKILLLSKGAMGLDSIKQYVDHIAFGKKDANELARAIYINRE